MFALYKKELQSYFLSPIAYFVIAFFMATFSLTFIQDIGNVSSSTYTFSFPSIFYVNIFYFIFLLPLLTMRTFSEERKNGTETLLLSSPLNVTQIVMAKFLATATILLMMLVVSLFYPKKDTGARALRAIIEDFMLDIMYDFSAAALAATSARALCMVPHRSLATHSQ